MANEDGTIAHAQLSFGNGMIMLGSVVDTEFGRLMKQPDEIGGAETQCAYVIVADADVLYRRAKTAGAQIVRDIQDEATVVAASAVATRRVTCGTSGPSTRGELVHYV